MSYTAPGTSTDFSTVTLGTTCGLFGLPLNTGGSCIISVRFAPKLTDLPNSTQTRTLTVTGRQNGTAITPLASSLSGTAQ
jgi:hypothetical protein